MSNVAETLKLCHRIVWEARAEMQGYWPTPTTEDALLFAFTELGEAVDAYLRSKPQYARNNAKDLDVLDELCDCAMMLLTALGPEPLLVYSAGFSRIGPPERTSWQQYIDDIAVCMELQIDPNEFTGMLWATVERVAIYPGMDLPARLTARLARIKAKQMPVDNDLYAQALARHAGELA